MPRATTAGEASTAPGNVGRPEKREPRGLGGWLVWVIAGLVLNVVFCTLGMFTLWQSNFTGPNWVTYFNSNSQAYDAGVVARVYLRLGYLVIFVGLSICNFILYLRKSVFFRWCTLVAINLQSVFFLFSAVSIVSSGNSSDNDNSLVWSGMVLVVIAVVPAAVWIPYFIRSRRVKNTFRKVSEPESTDPPLIEKPVEPANPYAYLGGRK